MVEVPTMLSKPIDAFFLDSRVWKGILEMFLSQPPQEATRVPHSPYTWVPMSTGRVFSMFFTSFHRILVLLLYILQHRKIMSRCLEQNVFFFLAGVEKSLSASIVYKSTGKVVVKAALCPVDDIKYEKVGWWRGPHVIYSVGYLLE